MRLSVLNYRARESLACDVESHDCGRRLPDPPAAAQPLLTVALFGFSRPLERQGFGALAIRTPSTAKRSWFGTFRSEVIVGCGCGGGSA